MSDAEQDQTVATFLGAERRMDSRGMVIDVCRLRYRLRCQPKFGATMTNAERYESRLLWPVRVPSAERRGLKPQLPL